MRRHGSSRRRRPVGSIAAAVMLAALVSALPPAAGAAAVADIPVDDPAAAQLATDWGVPYDEARRRMARQQQLDPFEEHLRPMLGDRFAGIWIDQANGGLIMVGVTGEVPYNQIRQLAAGFGLGVLTIPIPARHSLAQLEHVNAVLADRLTAVNAGADRGIGLGVRTDLNAVEIVLPAGALTAAQQVFVDSAVAAHGLAVRVVTSADPDITLACVRPHCDEPLRGGVQIETDRGRCTAGFITHERAMVYPRGYYVLTAGHCIAANPAATWYGRTANGVRKRIGEAGEHHFGAAGDLGTVFIGMPGGTPAPTWRHQGSIRRWVMASPPWLSPEGDAVVTYRPPGPGMALPRPRPGAYVCKSGIRTGTTCGYVTGFARTVHYAAERVSVRGLTSSTMCSWPGDSGAPVLTASTATGIVSGGTSSCDTTYFQPITSALDRLGVTIVTT